MILEFKYQEHYSRGELLLRSILGLFYIIIPHAFLLFFVGIAAGVLQFLSFWIILFTGRYPESWFEFQVKYMRWSLRLNGRVLNIADGYPAFGLNAEDDNLIFEVPYPENISRSSVLLRFLFGFFYVMIPHGFILLLLGMAVNVISTIAWFLVLFTGKYPKSMFDFVVSYLRWSQRVSLYLAYMTDTYPPFSGEPDQLPEPVVDVEAMQAAQAEEETRKQKENPDRFMPPTTDDGGTDKPSDDTPPKPE